MDIYVVVDGAARPGRRLVGASTSLQGAEELRADQARRRAEEWIRLAVEPMVDEDRKVAFDLHYALAYDGMSVENTELRDDE